MLELIATCIIAAGLSYSPPSGWKVEAVVSNEVSKTLTVTLHRVVLPHEKVEAPVGCSITDFQVKE